jgi:uncharacterized protein DUF3568
VYGRLLALILVALTLSGCVALAALPALGLSAMSDAAGGAAKAGVEHTMGGSVYRTFSAPLEDVRDAVLRSFADLEIDLDDEEELKDGSVTLKAEALHRHISIGFEPVTPALTRLKVHIRRGWFGRDESTANELIDQTTRALDEVRPIGGAFPRAPSPVRRGPPARPAS